MVHFNGQLAAQVNPDGSKYFSHSDHLGSVSSLSNEAGEVIENSTFAPFGELLSGGETSRYDYEGKEYDSTTGLIDFHFRQYNPSTGLFMQPDTLIQNLYDPQTLNRYAFERNNPYGKIDPTGHKSGSGTAPGTMYQSSNPYSFQRDYLPMAQNVVPANIDPLTGQEKGMWPEFISTADEAKKNIEQSRNGVYIPSHVREALNEKGRRARERFNNLFSYRYEDPFANDPDYNDFNCNVCTNYFPDTNRFKFIPKQINRDIIHSSLAANKVTRFTFEFRSRRRRKRTTVNVHLGNLSGEAAQAVLDAIRKIVEEREK